MTARGASAPLHDRFTTATALRVGIGLTQIGEFSFILAQVSLHSTLITREVYNATLAASLVTILVNAALFKLLERFPVGMAKPAERATPFADS